MRFELKKYQTEAVKQTLTTLGYARQDWHSRQRRTAFALSSTTGSGKTVIAATVIEALLHGSDEFDVEYDPSAVLLWVSKDPSLNVQTRSRFIESADRIPTGDLVVLDKDYADSSLQTGNVYFINPDKLRDGSLFVKHTDQRQVTFWEILRNTIEDANKTLYMILDEAHEGMRAQTKGDQTIVQRMINGNGVNPAVPVVWGISATVKRFDEAMARADSFTKEKNIVIDPKDVQESGLLKNALFLDIPDEPGEFGTTMVRDATLDFVDVCERWNSYCSDQRIDPVVPLMVVQIPNKVVGQKDALKSLKDEDDQLHRILETIRKHWPEMPDGCVAHVLGDRATIEVGAYLIPKVAPQDVQHDQRIRILVAKDAVSTGWDCPRAEVLVSLRPGEDDTYVTQLLGRMVRTPLAQETSVERLNEASCYLPYFNRDTAKRVAEEIMGLREPRSGERSAAVARVFLKPVTLARNTQNVPQEVFDLVEGLPSFAKPATSPKPIKRILRAAQALAQDDIVPGANQQAHEELFKVLDAIAASNVEAIAAAAHQVQTADIRRILVTRGEEGNVEETTAQREADSATVDDALRQLRRLISNSVMTGYLGRNMQAAITKTVEDNGWVGDADITGVRAHVAALGFIEVDVQGPVEDAANALTQFWLSSNANKIAALPDSRQPVYAAIQDMAREAERVRIDIPLDTRVDTVDTDRTVLPTEKLHLLSTPEGDYPLDAKMANNRWERATIKHELASSTLVGWYRNPSSAGKSSLRIAHKTASIWRSVQPDFVFVHMHGADLRPSVIDPHSAHLGDAAPKLKALAEYADEHGDLFERVIAVGIEKDGTLIGLDLKSSKIRRAVYESPADKESIVKLFTEHGTKYTVIPDNVLTA